MSIPTDEQIRKWRERWTPELTGQVVEILSKNRVQFCTSGRFAEMTIAEIFADRSFMTDGAERMKNIRKILPPDDFDDYNSKDVTLHIDNPHSKDFVTPCQVPVLDLRGIPLKLGNHLEFIFLPYAHLEGATINWSHLECGMLKGAHLQKAKLISSFLSGACLDNADLQSASLSHTTLEGVHFNSTKICGTNFSFAIVGNLRSVDSQCEIDPINEDNLLFRDLRKSTFANNKYLPDCSDALKSISWSKIRNLPENIEWWDEKKWQNDFKRIKESLPWRMLLNRWFYTRFNKVQVNEIEIIHNIEFERYLKDQQFLYQFKENHPIAYWFWKVFSDCGGSMLVVGFWAIITIFMFAILYSASFLIYPYKLIGTDPTFVQWLYMSFDIFTSFGISKTNPTSNWGVFWVFLETIFGYITLGMLISVLTNKYARRS